MSTVRIPPALRSETEGKREVQVAGETLREVLEAMLAAHPSLQGRVFDGDRIQPFVNVFVDGTDVRFLAGLDSPVRPDSTVLLLPAMAGGESGGRPGTAMRAEAATLRVAVLPAASLADDVALIARTAHPRTHVGRVALAIAAAAVVAVLLAARAEGRARLDGAGASELFVWAEFSPRPLRSQKAVRWRVRLTNPSTAGRRLVFRSGKRADVVLRRGGVARYRWSEGRVFVPLVERRTLPPGKSWTFVLTDTLDVPPGRYQLVATIAARPAVRAPVATVVVKAE